MVNGSDFDILDSVNIAANTQVCSRFPRKSKVRKSILGLNSYLKTRTAISSNKI